MVAEVVFTLPFAGLETLNWRALVDVETNAVLWLRALIAGVNGLVFTYDLITSTGVLTNTADQPNATLNPLRDDVTLDDLDGPVAGMQSLAGANVVGLRRRRTHRCSADRSDGHLGRQASRLRNAVPAAFTLFGLPRAEARTPLQFLNRMGHVASLG